MPTAILRRALTHTLFALLALGLLAMAPALAQATTSQNFTGCGSFNTSAPANAISASVTVKGSSGGYSGYGGSPGSGATVSFTTPVSSSQTLYGSVGCQPGGAGYDSDGGNGYTGSNGGGGSGGYGFNDGGTGGSASWLGYQPATYDAYGIAGGGGGAGGQGQWYNGGGSAGVGGQGGNANANGGNGGTEYDYSESAGGGSGGYSGANGGGGNYGRSNGCSANNTGGGCGGGGYYEYYCDFGCYYEGSGGGGGGGGGYVGGGGGGGGYTDSDDYGGGGGGGGGGSSAVLNGATSTGQGTNSGNGSVSVTYTIGAVASVTPGTQSFGSVTTGRSQSEIFTLTNTSADTPLNSIGLSVGGAYSVPAVQNLCAGRTLAVNGGSCTFVVTFAPTTDGSQGGDLSVSSNATNGTQTVDISGSGEYPPSVSVQSARDFGTVTTGQTQDETVTVTNAGDKALHPGTVNFGGTNPDQFAIVAGNDTCSNRTVTPGGTCTIELAFSPASDGAKSATLSIPSDDPNTPATVALTGTGSNPPTLGAESAQDFGTVTTGQTQNETVTVTNTGDQTLNVAQATVGGTNPGQFALGTDSCSTQTVPPGGTCTVDVTFAPSSDGAKTATLSIPSDDPNTPATVALTGTGSNPPTLGAESAQDFGTVTTGQTQNETVTVTNTGDQALNIAQASIGGTNPGQFALGTDTCSTQTVSAGDTCTVDVTFAPSSDGAKTATLSIPSDDPNTPANVTLTGAGSNPPTASVESSQDFGTVTTGQTQHETITVTDTGDQTLNIGQATVAGTNPGQFALATDTCSTQTVNAGDSCTIDVAFAPTADGAKSATLSIPSNDAASPATVTLTGTGSNLPALGVEPAQDFATVTDGQSKSQTVTVTDTGDQDLTVGQAAITGADAPDFTLAHDTCSTVTLHAAGTCAVTVQFAPATRRAETATLSLPSNDAASPATVTLTGTGSKAADVSATPASLTFGTVMTGQSPVKTVTVTNPGDQALHVGQATISGAQAALFALGSGQDACSAQTVPAGGSCTIAVQFAPTAAGDASATLTVPSDAASGSVTVALTGAGQTPAPPAPASQAPTLTVPTVSAGGLTVQEGPGAAPSGLTVQLSAPGTLTVTIQRNVNGKWVPASTQIVSAPQAGPLHVTLSANASGRTLAPGQYRVVLTASAHGQTGTPVTMPLTVKPPANGPHGQPRLLSVTVNPHTITWQREHSSPTLWVTFLLSRASKLQMTLQARSHGHWQQVAAATTHVLAGSDRVQLVGRWRGRLVPARVVRLTVTASAAGQRSVTKTFYITVRHAPGWARNVTRAFLSAP